MTDEPDNEPTPEATDASTPTVQQAFPGDVPTSPMPLSMPPMTGAVASSATEPPQRELTPPASPMPLSMPPTAGNRPPLPPPPPPPSFGTGWPPPPSAPRPPAGTRNKVIAGAIVLALLAGGLGAGLGATFTSSSAPNRSIQTFPLPSGIVPPIQVPSTPVTPTAPSPGWVAKVAAEVSPAVVDVDTEVASPIGSTGERAEGTGMILTSNGEVLTNNHVVEDATAISVTIAGRTGSYAAQVLGVDPGHDVALLKIVGAQNLPVVHLANSASVAVGNSVVAIGNALGLGGSPSVVSGSISATNRSVTATEGSSGSSENLSGLLQTTAPIEEGDSGGPLVNSAGQVVGMDTAAASTGPSGSNVGFAIPINAAKTIATSIAAGRTSGGIIIGESAFIGIGQQSVNQGFNFNFGTSSGNSGTSTPRGAVIGNVISGSPAASAGLTAGDVITSFDGVAIPATASATAQWTKLRNLVLAHKPGDSISLTFRNTSNDQQTVHLKLAGIPL